MNTLGQTPKLRRERTATTLSSSSDNSSGRDTVQVVCRLRPLKDGEESTIRLNSSTELVLTTPIESKSVHKEVHCKFQHIFTSFATQNEIFEHVAHPLLENLMNGKNALLFTYGVTGSGKTYTLTGDHNNPGIMPKCIYSIFNTIENFQTPKFVIKSDRMNGFEIQSDNDAMQDKLNELRSTRTPRSARTRDKIYVNDGTKILTVNAKNLYAVFVSYVEIYNNTVFDLLDDKRHNQQKILREDFQKNMYVNGVVEVEVKSAEEAFELFNLGQKRKRMGNTVLNSDSSRSHSIFNIRLVQVEQVAVNDAGQQIVPDTNQFKVAQLSLVDLAGSERTNRTQNTGKLLKEASQINNSLMSLRSCLEILRSNQLSGTNKLVPYRDSRLTLLFKNYFEGEGRISMIVCVNPSAHEFEENLQVMKFAETSQDVRIITKTPDTRLYTPVKKTIIKKKAPTPSSVKIKSTLSFLLGSKVPEIKLRFDLFEESLQSLDKLTRILKSRDEKQLQFFDDISRKETHFRKRLLDLQQNDIVQLADLQNAKALLKKEKQRSSNIATKLGDAEAALAEMMAKNDALEENIRSLQNVVSEKDLKINKTILEKERTKQKLALQSEKMTHELDAKLRKQREHLRAATKAKDQKLQKLRQVLDNDQTPREVTEEEPEVAHNYAPQQAPASMSRRAPAVQTPARRRRSRSTTDEKWLEHNTVKPVALGTVLQPTMKKRKSVTKLDKASDVTNPKQNKYCLIAQKQDTDGEMETRLYKADILPTCGGGAQVIFSDVETLRQESPTAGSK